MRHLRAVAICLISSSWFLGIVVAQSPPTGRTGRLTVDIADAAENAPIPGAFVYVHNDFTDTQHQRDVSVPLNPQGRGEVALTEGSYDVFVASGGFVPKCRVVKISADKATPVVERLAPDVEHMEY
jgi:hypothetical protein